MKVKLGSWWGVHKSLGVSMKNMLSPRVSRRVHDGNGGSMRVMEGS